MLHIFLTFTLIAMSFLQQPAEVSTRFKHAVELQQQGKLDEAVNEYRAVLKIKPDYAEAYANLGVALARQGKNEEAAIAYETALKLAPQFVQIWLNVGILYYRAQEFEKAINAFDKFLEAQPNNLQARQLLGLSLVEIGYNTAAIDQLQPTLTAGTSSDPAVLYALGLAYVRLSKMPEAEKMVSNLASFPAGIPTSHLLKGQLFLARFEFESAVKELQEAQKLNPELPRVNYSLGLCYYKLSLNKEGLVAFEAEYKRRPKDFTTIYYLAYLNEAEGNLEAARQFVDLASSMQPTSVQVLMLLGKILSQQGKNVEAAAALEKAIAQDPKDSAKHYLLGKIYRDLGRREDSAREYNESRRLKSEEVKNDREKTDKP